MCEGIYSKALTARSSLPDVEIARAVPIAKHRFLDHFKGFERIPVVREIFGDETDSVLANLEVEFFDCRFFYMGVNQEDGHVLVNANYLRHGNKRDLYLDVIHELVHIRQFREGKETFDETEYVDRPTEVEAYGYTVREARRLGMTDNEIVEYLKVPWLDERELRRLAKNSGVRIPQGSVLASGPRKWPH